MEFFIVIIAGVFLLLVLLAVWVVSRVASLSGTQAKVSQLEQEFDRLISRVSSLEKQAAEAIVQPLYATVQKPAPSNRPTPVAKESVQHPVSVKPPALRQPLPQSEPVSPAHDAIPAPPPSRQTPVPATSIPSPIAARVAASMPAAVEDAPAPVKRSSSLEERLGQNWLNKLGIVTLVTGLALLLGYQMRTLGPVGKSITGAFVSIAILVTGLVLERRERYRIFARAAIGGGWALLYFITFALFHVPAMQVLRSQALDLVLMLAVAAAMVVHSLRYRSQAVTSLAFLLGCVTVSISHVTVFSLVAGAILAAGLVAVAFRERWFLMVLGGLVAVYANHFLWLQRVLPDGGQLVHSFPEFLPSAALLLFYWLLFRLFYIFRVPDNNRDQVCSTLNALLNSAGLLTLLKYQSAHPEWAFYGLLALGTAELAMAFLARRRHHRAFVTLSCIGSLFLLAAVPFHFSGSNWSLMWLLQSEMLFVAGLTLHETVFRRLGMLSAFAAVGHLLIVGALPVFNLRQLAPDVSHHTALSIAFACAALAAWFNAEFATRHWPHITGDALDRNALRATSYVGALCASMAAWLTLAGPWTLLPWLAVALSLAFASDRLRSTDLAQQAELLTVAAVVRAAVINFMQWDHFNHTTSTSILSIGCVLLYAHMRRRQPSYLLAQRYIQPAYTWVAAALLSTLAWYALQPAAVGVAWCVLGLAFLEIGLSTRKAFFREQGFLLLAASFLRLFFANVALDATPRLYTLLPLVAIYAYAYQRLYAKDEPTWIDRIAGGTVAWFALITVATLLYFSLRPEWVCIGGAALAVAVLVLARVLRRPLFTAQAMTLIVVTVARTLAFNLLSAEPLSRQLTESRIFTVSMTCALLFAALPVAFSIRKQQGDAEMPEATGLRAILSHPEQLFFFAPLVILFAWIPLELRAGMITVGWSALGLVTFLVALAVKERSFRIAGLGVLLVSVGKIIVVDIWQASPIDRYITLIVMGAALLLVSFLYSRYRETILELL